MPALAFGLGAAKSRPGGSKPAPKRKAFFDDDDDDVPQADPSPPPAAKKAPKPLRPLSGFSEDGAVTSSTKPSNPLQHGRQPAPGGDKYTNLSALRSAKLHDDEVSKIDASVYDYDAAYETFHATKDKKPSGGEAASGPKYMGSLLQSADVRKRDQLRAREKLLQREREAEGDEFADKEKFVTGAYKKQQDEVRRLEEEEKRREEAEDERRRQGRGMTAFHKRVLEKDEERMQSIKEAEEEATRRREIGIIDDAPLEEERSEAQVAADLNKHGARIVLNDEGEVVDKRQLLSAGLNAAPKKPGATTPASRRDEAAPAPGYWKTTQVRDARDAQRERQTRMVERQLEEMAAKQREAEVAEEQALQEKNKSKITEADKFGARERFLQRKKEREEEARKKKEGDG